MKQKQAIDILKPQKSTLLCAFIDDVRTSLRALTDYSVFNIATLQRSFLNAVEIYAIIEIYGLFKLVFEKVNQAITHKK